MYGVKYTEADKCIASGIGCGQVRIITVSNLGGVNECTASDIGGGWVDSVKNWRRTSVWHQTSEADVRIASSMTPPAPPTPTPPLNPSPFGASALVKARNGSGGTGHKTDFHCLYSAAWFVFPQRSASAGPGLQRIPDH